MKAEPPIPAIAILVDALRRLDGEAVAGWVGSGGESQERLRILQRLATEMDAAQAKRSAVANQLQAGVFIDADQDSQHEVPEYAFVLQLGAVAGAIGEQMLEARPTLADGVEDGLGTGTLGDVSLNQIDH